MFLMLPVVMIIYAGILVLYCTAELLFFVFDKGEKKHENFIKRIIFPLYQR